MTEIALSLDHAVCMAEAIHTGIGEKSFCSIFLSLITLPFPKPETQNSVDGQEEC